MKGLGSATPKPIEQEPVGRPPASPPAEGQPTQEELWSMYNEAASKGDVAAMDKLLPQLKE